jgi:hypothetical protein
MEDFMLNGDAALSFTEVKNGAGESEIISTANKTRAEAQRIFDSNESVIAAYDMEAGAVLVKFGRPMSRYQAVPGFTLRNTSTDVVVSGSTARWLDDHSTLAIDVSSSDAKEDTYQLEFNDWLFTAGSSLRWALSEPLRFGLTRYHLGRVNAVVLDGDAQIGVTDYDPVTDQAVSFAIGFDRVGGALTADITSTPFNEDNMANALDGREFRTPTVSIPLYGVPTGDGASEFNIQILDGDDNIPSQGERYVELSVNMEWSGDGQKLLLEMPPQTVSGHYMTSYGLRVDFTVENLDSDFLSVSQSGIDQPPTLDIKVTALIEKIRGYLLSDTFLREGIYTASVRFDSVQFPLDVVDESGNGSRVDQIVVTFAVGQSVLPQPVDTDGDGVPDEADAFPNNPNESADSDGDGIGDNTDPYPNDPDNVGGSGGGGSAFVPTLTGAFGGALVSVDSANNLNYYLWPTGAEDWAGFANEDASLYPLMFEYGGRVTFKASVSSGGLADVRFRFERLPFPDTEPSFDTEVITVSGAQEATYTIEIPSQGANTFESLLFYVMTRDEYVSLNDVEIISYDSSGGPGEEPGQGDDASVPVYLLDGAFGNATVDIESETFTFPSGAESWAGFAATNAEIYPLSFPEGGRITMQASAETPTSVYFRFEYRPFPDVDPSFVTATVLVEGSDLTDYTIEIPSQGDNTYSSLLMYIVERDQPVYVPSVRVTAYGGSDDGDDDASVPVYLLDGAFGNATVDIESETFTFPSGAESWAGFAATNAEIYPLSFPEGGRITMQASAETPTSVYFRFEYRPFPDVDPSFVTATVLVEGSDLTDYTIEIPSQGDNTYSSLLMYIVERDQPVYVPSVRVTAYGGSDDGDDDASVPVYLLDGAFGNATVDIESETFTFPSGAESWAGFAATNAEIYPLSFPEGGRITMQASAETPTSVYFRFEYRPFPDVDPSFVTATVLVEGSDLTDYTIEIPSQGDNTYSSLLMYIVERDQPVYVPSVRVTAYGGSDDGDDDASVPVYLLDGAFGNATVDIESETFTFPSGAESWAGFAATNAEIYPLSFPEGGRITMQASAETPTSVYFRFEYRPFPDVDPSFVTATVLVEGSDLTDYTIEIPSQGDNTYSSLLMYIVERDQPVYVPSVRVTAYGGSGTGPVDTDGDGVADDDDAFPTDPSETVDSDGDGIGNNADTDNDNDGVIDAEDLYPFDPSEAYDSDGDGIGDNADPYPSDPTNTGDSDSSSGFSVVADFTTGAFGNALVDTETETYTFPTGAESWAGFANNADIYPLSFAEGGSITFKASAATPTNLRFRFEYKPFPDVDPAYDTANVLITSTDLLEYAIEIPPQGSNTYESFLMYIVEQDSPVVVKDVVVTSGTPAAESPSSFVGKWVLAGSNGSLGVGPAEFDVSWWSNDAGVTATRACLFDDEYVFNSDGSFRVEYQDETWLEPWQSGGAEECGAPVAPHDGSIPGTWNHDQEAGTLTIGGQGSYIGLPKAINGAEISSAADVPDSITYNAYLNDDGTLSVTVEAGDGVWWNYKLAKTTVDTDGDGVADDDDAFPTDPSETVDSDGDGIGNNADTDNDNDGVIDAEDLYPFDPSEAYDSDGDGIGDNADPYPSDPTNTGDSDSSSGFSVVADFTTGAFGNALVDTETETYTFPTGAESWAGFANNADIYPLSFAEGGSITFKASAATPTNLRFRFEYKPFPDVDPAYDTANVLITSTDLLEYAIEIPPQGSNTYESFLMYIVEQDSPVVVKDVVVTSGTPAAESPSSFVGKWVLAGSNGSLGVGPAEFDVSWWSNDAGVTATRACLFDDEYVFNSDGSFRVEYQDETWLEPWQSGGAEECGAPVAPHDGSIPGTWNHDQEAGTLTIGGQGSYIGLPKAINGAEISSAADVPGSITYNVYEQEDGSYAVTVEAGDGVWWNYKIVKTAGPAEPSPIAGTWYMAQSEGSLGVGPAEFDVTWWSNDAGVTALRACYFDDAYVFGADGSFSNVQDGDTWLEPWQSGGADDECGVPVAPHDGSIPGTWNHDQEAGTLTIGGQGSYIGLPKAINGAEIASAADVPDSITYNAYLNADGTMSVTVEAGDGVWWNYVLER